MDITKGGEVVYLEEGVLRTWRGDIIARPTLCIDGDILVYFGDYSDVECRLHKHIEKMNRLGVKSTMKIIPIYERLSAEDCYYVIEIANSYTASGFIKSLDIMFDTKNFYTWLDLEKESKRVG